MAAGVGDGGDALHEWLRRVLVRQAPGFREPITDDTPLVDDGLCLDSIALIEVIGAIESGLGVTVEEDDIRPENFGTVGRLVRFVRALSPAPAPGSG